MSTAIKDAKLYASFFPAWRNNFVAVRKNQWSCSKKSLKGLKDKVYGW